ncbi:MAG: hypothetical protein KJZ85_13905 [Rhodobacteraceae bacterium]|jgi:hypothetical protein|nr:hypothetical protein [Paracoccaceae bacterium]
MLVRAVLLAGAAAAAGLALRARGDIRADRAERARLRALQPPAPARFDPAMVAALPLPARRYFAFAIAPGTPLWPVVEVGMCGTLALGTREAPRILPMAACQTLAAPHGFLWELQSRLLGLPVTGSDSAGWTRMRVAGLLPVARAGGSADFARSAFGRMVAEALFWSPASLLPGPGIAWEAVDAATARVTATHGGLAQAVDLRLDGDGQPLDVVFQRWTDANAARRFRLQPFGGTLADFRDAGGFRLPFRVDAGNMFGTAEWFPFFRAEVTAIRFPAPGPGR